MLMTYVNLLEKLLRVGLKDQQEMEENESAWWLNYKEIEEKDENFQWLLGKKIERGSLPEGYVSREGE